MKIADHTQDFPGEGWCVVVMTRKWPIMPLAVFDHPEAAREWLQSWGEETGKYALCAVPLATPSTAGINVAKVA